MQPINFTYLQGKTLTNVEILDNREAVIFTPNNGPACALWHWQECCESVYLADICGDVNDLIGTPILLAEEVSHECGATPSSVPNVERSECYGDSFTWTFYKLSTRKGSVTLRWLGESNGYYSECADFAAVSPEEVERLRENGDI